MIHKVTKVIREHPEWLRSKDSVLSFMKVSMPTSGTVFDKGLGKVIIFVFEQGQTTPTICIKTVREYRAREVIRRNYNNLKLLSAGVSGSAFESLFVSPLYLYDDGNDIFCVESVCPGVMLSAQAGGADLVIEKYMLWQAHLAQTASRFLSSQDMMEYVNTSMEALKLPEIATNTLRKYLKRFPMSTNVRLPVLVQHGDMTPDNVLIEGDNICLVDYDYVGVNILAGFDLFNFLSKSSHQRQSLRAACSLYFPRYFESIGATTETYDNLLFIYYLEECNRKWLRGVDTRGDEIIGSFETLMNRK